MQNKIFNEVALSAVDPDSEIFAGFGKTIPDPGSLDPE
jgi:hypothetical protein